MKSEKVKLEYGTAFLWQKFREDILSLLCVLHIQLSGAKAQCAVKIFHYCLNHKIAVCITA